MKFRQFYFVLLFALVPFVSFSQKTFEGKVVMEITWENVPEKMKIYYKTSVCTTYYKKDKSRTESSSSNYTSSIIDDYNLGKRLMFMDLTIGIVKQKTATISNLISPSIQSVTIEKIEEYKMINNYNCQKVIVTTTIDGKESKSYAFLNNDFSTNSVVLSSGKTYMNLVMESINDITGAGTMIIKVKEIHEEAVSDDLFDLTPPRGYKVTDMTTKANMELLNKVSANLLLKNGSSNVDLPGNNVATQKKIEPTQLKAVEKYTNVSDTDLKKLLNEALAKEDFETAHLLKTEIDTRKKNSMTKYSQNSDAELTKLLNDALKIEDYTAAQELKKEMDNRKK